VANFADPHTVPAGLLRAFRILCQLIIQHAVQASLKVNRQLGQRRIPVLYRHSPFPGCVLYPHVEQLEQAVFIRESALGLGQFPELVMHRFNGIRSIKASAPFSSIFRPAKVRLHNTTPYS